MPSIYEMGLWLIMTLGLCTGILCVIWKLIYYLLDKRMKKSQSLLMTRVTADHDHKNVLMAWTQATGDDRHKNTSVWGKVLAEKLRHLIEESYPYEIYSEWCNLERTQCNTIYKLTGKLGNTIMIAFSWHPHPYSDLKGRNIWVGKDSSTDVRDYVTFDKDDHTGILLAESVDIVFPVTIDDNHSDVLDLVDLLARCEVERVEHAEQETTATTYRLVSYKGEYNLQRSMKQIVPLSNAVLDHSYMPVKINYGGEAHELDMSAALDLVIMGLTQGENVYIDGSYGTGKSAFAEQMQHRLSRNGVNVILVTPGIIDELQTSAGQGAFFSALQQVANLGGRSVILIDEAEEALASDNRGMHTKSNTLLLQLLAGDLHNELNIAMVLTFNAKPAELNEALFRAKRQGFHFTLEALDRTHADSLVEDLRRRYPDKVFDSMAYEAYFADDTKLPGGSITSAKGFITLAEVYSCMVDRDMRAYLINALREKAGKPALKEVAATTRGDRRSSMVKADEAVPSAVQGQKIIPPAPPPRPKAPPVTPVPVAMTAEPGGLKTPSNGHHKKKKRRR